MIYVGIDAASKKHDCYIVSSANIQSAQVLTISNDSKGFEELKTLICNLINKLGGDNVRIGLESTGHYSHNILHYLVGNGFDTMLINPLLTNMERKASSVRKTKTDTIDAKSICTFLMRNQEFKPYTLASYHSRSLKSLSRRRISLVKQMTKHKQELHALVTMVFPEYLSVFSRLHINVSLEILYKYSTPSNIAKARIDGLTNTIRKHSNGRHGRQTAALIKELSKNTIGDKDELYAFQIKLCVEMIRTLHNQIKTYEAQIRKIMDANCPVILSVPGISYVTGAIIVGEIGNILRFDSPSKLLAFAGLDPVVHQSGNYDANRLTASKRGSSYLRWAFHTAASIIIHHDSTFASYYAKKRKEGKHHLVALGHVSKKLVRVVFSVLRYTRTFVPQN